MDQRLHVSVYTTETGNGIDSIYNTVELGLKINYNGVQVWQFRRAFRQFRMQNGSS
jgi:hypothetical protein